MNIKGFGKLEFVPVTEDTYPIPSHKFIINKLEKGFEVIDVTTGMVSFDDSSIENAIKDLAAMIINFTCKNIDLMGKEKFEEFYKEFSNDENYIKLHEEYEKVKSYFDKTYGVKAFAKKNTFGKTKVNFSYMDAA